MRLELSSNLLNQERILEMTSTSLPSPSGDESDVDFMVSILREVVPEYDGERTIDFFHRRVRKFTASEKREIKTRLSPYISEGWIDSGKARAAFNVLAAMRVEGVDVSSIVDALELSIDHANDKFHRNRLFEKLSNLLIYLLSSNQVEDLERFFAIQYPDFDRWQRLVLRKAVQKKWFREDQRFAYLATDERIDEKTQEKLKKN